MSQRAWQSAAYDARPCSRSNRVFFRSAYLRRAAVVAHGHVFIGSPQTQHAGVCGAPPRIAEESTPLHAPDSYSDQEALMSHVSSATAKLKDE